MFTFYKDYQPDFSGRSSIASKEETLDKMFRELMRVARELEDKQEYDVSITVTDDRENLRWVGRLVVKFPKRQYHQKV